EITLNEGAKHDGSTDGPWPGLGRRVAVAARAGGGSPAGSDRSAPDRGGQGEDARRATPQVVADRPGNTDLRRDDRVRRQLHPADRRREGARAAAKSGPLPPER